jgi:hypothetical protein
MSTNPSIQDVLARLEAKVEHLSEQVELHSRQEVFHREQKEQSAAELERVSRHLEEFRRTAGAVLEIAGPEARSAAASDDGPDLGGKPMLSRLISAVIADKRGDERFNATQLAREVERRFGKRLGRRVDPRSVASQLRRLFQRGKIHQIQKGQAHREAVFIRERPKS